jgi:hypothetical protein
MVLPRHDGVAEDIEAGSRVTGKSYATADKIVAKRKLTSTLVGVVIAYHRDKYGRQGRSVCGATARSRGAVTPRSSVISR